MPSQTTSYFFYYINSLRPGLNFELINLNHWYLNILTKSSFLMFLIGVSRSFLSPLAQNNPKGTEQNKTKETYKYQKYEKISTKSDIIVDQKCQKTGYIFFTVMTIFLCLFSCRISRLLRCIAHFLHWIIPFHVG